MNVSEKKIEEIIQSVRHQFKDDVVQAIEDNNRIVVDLLRQEIKASAQNVKDELRWEMRVMRDDIIDVIDNGVLPQIDGLDRRVTRLERWAKI